MANLGWQETTNLEDSTKEFIETSISDEELTAFYQGNNLPINVKIGYPEDASWELPVISIYELNRVHTRNFIGTSNIINTVGLVIDIRAKNGRMQSDLASWLIETIKRGFPYYEYSPNPANPNSPTKVENGNVLISQFNSNEPVRLQNSDEFDLHRQRIVVSVEIN